MSYVTHGTLLPVHGLNTNAPAEYIDKQNSPNIKNINVSHNVIEKRTGITKMGAVIDGTIKDILNSVEVTINDIDNFVRIGADQVEKWNSGTSSWDNVSTGTLGTSASSEMSICTPNLSGDRIIVFTSTGINPQKYTGSGNHADLGGSPPQAKYCEDFGTYTLLAHITNDSGNTYRNRVQWCDTGDPENWSTGNAGSVDLFEGTDITGIKQYGNYVTLHKQDLIYVGYKVATTAVFRFDAKYTPGTICDATIKQLPSGELAYLSKDGLRLFNGQTSILATDPINDDLREQMNMSYAYRSWGAIVEDLNEYWFGVPIGSNTYPQDIYRYNYLTRKLYKNNYGFNVRYVSSFSNTITLSWDQDSGTWDSDTIPWNAANNSTGYPVTVLHTDTGYSYRLNGSTTADDTASIDALYESKDLEAGDKGQLGRWVELEVWAKGTSVDVTYSIDGGTLWYNIGTLSLSSAYPSDNDPDILYFDVVSSKIRFRFRDNSTTNTFTLKQFTGRYSPREFRGR